jgi:hypothetical protein
MEVYLHNPVSQITLCIHLNFTLQIYLTSIPQWLTYGIGLHRIREAGLGTELMDDLDEKAFTLDEIRDFCLEFFVGKNQLSLRNPKIDFNGFIEDLQILVDKEKLVWNPIKNKLCPWVDVNKLKIMYAKTQSKNKGGSRRAYVRSNTHEAPEAGDRSRLKSRKQTINVESLRSSMLDMSKPTSLPTRSSDPDCARSDPDFSRSKSSSNRNNGSSNGSGPAPKDLKEYIQQWSHEGPSYKKLKPLEVLLVDVPNLFPPTNSFVESHEYYFKWKEFSEDAFSGESGDELKELLRRASRKSKLFLHPDKLPSDLTENQDLLFKSVWNVIMESEAATMQ